MSEHQDARTSAVATNDERTGLRQQYGRSPNQFTGDEGTFFERHLP